MKKITVLVKEVGKEPEVREIENTLEAQQEIVGGWIEAVYVVNGIYLICNEEGKLNGLAPNFEYGNDVIAGNAFFTKIDEEGNNASLTTQDIELIKSKFV